MAPPEPADEAVPPRERGAIRISDRVITKIASHAAREALGELRGTRQGPVAHTTARASVSVRPAAGRGTAERGAERASDEGPVLGEARVHVAVELRYPCDIGRQCGAVRRVVTERVHTLAGMDVAHVGVTVERLHAASGPGAGEGGVR